MEAVAHSGEVIGWKAKSPNLPPTTTASHHGRANPLHSSTSVGEQGLAHEAPAACRQSEGDEWRYSPVVRGSAVGISPGLTPRSTRSQSSQVVSRKSPLLSGLALPPVPPASKARLSDPGNAPAVGALPSPRLSPAGRNSDPGARPRSHHEHLEGLHNFTLTALEAGLQLEVQKDESTKDTSFVWHSGSSLRRGLAVLFALALAVVLLVGASGYFYFSQRWAQRLLNQAQHASAERLFREDVEALRQVVTFAHFAELAVGVHSKVESFLVEEKNAEVWKHPTPEPTPNATP